MIQKSANFSLNRGKIRVLANETKGRSYQIGIADWSMILQANLHLGTKRSYFLTSLLK